VYLCLDTLDGGLLVPVNVMSKIIVSYRRSDSQAISGRIVDRLIAHFGDKSVFMDIESIPFGTDFRQHIKSALSQADVLLAIVGPEWLARGSDGRSRLQDDSDPVRVEIETALAEKLRIIPVLVQGAPMPKAGELPDSLRDFSFLNAAPVDVGRDFNSHIDRLIQSIDRVHSQKSVGVAANPFFKSPTPPMSAAPNRTSFTRLGAAPAVLLVVAGVASAAAWLMTSSLLPRSAPAPAAVAMAPKQTSPDPVAAAAASAPSSDDLQWDIVKNTSDAGVLRRFVELNPDSKHRPEAEQRIASLQAPPAPAVAPPGNGQTPASSAAEQPAKAPPTAASIAAPIVTPPQQDQDHAASSAGRFDGIWVATTACDKKGDVQAWTRQCIGRVKSGVFHCEWGMSGQPGYTQFDGTIAPDGSIQLVQKGLTIDASYSLVRRSGVKFEFPWTGQFDDTHAKATRVEGRTCRMDLVKQ
jgi:TIR domain